MIDVKLKHHYQQVCDQTTQSILRHPRLSMAQQLQQLAASVAVGEKADVYGRGELIESFEQHVANLLGKESAIFLPTGTLAQPLALKLHALHSSKSTIVLHPTSHLLLHEHRGVEELWQLTTRTTLNANTPFCLDELKQCCNSDTAAVVFELPLREIGGELPRWETLTEQVSWARKHRIKCHLDGARLWQVGHFYQRSLAQVADLFDSVYVSFYKDLGGISGAILAANHELIEEARIWARRAGGNPISLYPEILAARDGLQKYLPLMPQAVQYAIDLADQLNGIEHIAVTPCPPKAAMFHLTFALSPTSLTKKIIDFTAAHKVVILPLPRAGGHDHSICEISIGENAMSQPPEFWLRHFSAFAKTLAN